jgi:hypothetical protein
MQVLKGALAPATRKSQEKKVEEDQLHTGFLYTVTQFPLRNMKTGVAESVVHAFG